MLFGLPFLAFGLFMAWKLVATLGLWWSAQSWVETSAVITATDLKIHRDSDGTSYDLTASYRYEFGGEQFTGDRVNVADEFIGQKYARRKHAQLKKLLAKERKTVCFVDPANPAQSLLDRQLQFSSVLFMLPFVICFTLAGGGFAIGGLYASRVQQRQAKRVAEHPEEPWRQRNDWASATIYSSNHKSVLVNGIFALFWNGMSVPIFIMICIDQPDDWWVIPLVGLFPLVGLVLATAFVKSLLTYLRFGRTTFRMASTPGVVGGQLAGVVLVPGDLRPEEGFRVALRCQRKVTRRGSDGSETSTKLDWEDVRVIERTLSDPSGKRGVPIEFTIPSTAKPSDPNAKQPIEWELELKADLPGPDYLATFEVPVFITDASQDGVTVDLESKPYEQELSLAQHLEAEGLKLEEPPETIAWRLTSPPGRQLGTALTLAALGAIFLSVGIGIFWWIEEFPRWIFGPASTLVGFGIGWFSLELLLGYTELTIDGEQWNCRWGWWGLFRKQKKLTAAEVYAVQAKQGMSSETNGKAAVVWKNVRIRGPQGKWITVARNLKNRRTERMLIAELKQRGGLGRKKPAE